VNPRDVHSGNVALPGGKLDSGETSYDAVIRETSEEIGIDLSDISKFVYLGHMKEIDPYYASFRNKKMLLTVHCKIYFSISTVYTFHSAF
jgi:8-oxo-dGTP pyrophosphatase MutT (NUDIX family)